LTPKHISISALYGNLSKEAQDRAVQSPPEGSRKVVLSTNIAQTSLTIEGIKIVVDSGLQNVSVFNPFCGMDSLESQFISQDAATQRAGRAGRLSAGKTYHLWHKSKILLKHDIPEILQADLSPLLLELSLWGNENINDLKWMDTPPTSALKHAKELLMQLGALNETGSITPHGKAMSAFGLHPRLAHMLINAKTLDLGYESSLLAVLMTEKDIYTQSFGSSDLCERVSVLHDVAQKKQLLSKYVNIKQCQYLLKNAKRIEPKQSNSLNTAMLGILLAYAYPDRIAKQRLDRPNAYLLSNGKGATLHPQDELFRARFLVISDLDAKSREAAIYKAIELTQGDLESYHHDLIKTQDEADWNEEEARVEVRRVSRLGSIVLKESQIKNSNSEEVQEILIEALEEMTFQTLNWSKEAQSLRNRVDFLNHHSMDFPEFSEAYLKNNMKEWLAPYLKDITTLRAVQALDFYPILLGQLSYEQTKQLDSLAPAKLKVASGSNMPIDYSNPDAPVLAVRLQEMFGTKNTPSLLNGKIALTIHLLSPASRPMQVTKDLESFWKNTYDEVKKELRGKYKKHYWPDDPMEAQATSKTKKWM